MDPRSLTNQAGNKLMALSDIHAAFHPENWVTAGVLSAIDKDIGDDRNIRALPQKLELAMYASLVGVPKCDDEIRGKVSL